MPQSLTQEERDALRRREREGHLARFRLSGPEPVRARLHIMKGEERTAALMYLNEVVQNEATADAAMEARMKRAEDREEANSRAARRSVVISALALVVAIAALAATILIEWLKRED